MHNGEPDAKYSLRALRQACAALWIAQGFGPKQIQTSMGHTTVALTFDRYGYFARRRRASDDGDRRAVSRVRKVGGGD